MRQVYVVDLSFVSAHFFVCNIKFHFQFHYSDHGSLSEESWHNFGNVFVNYDPRISV